MCSSRHTLLFRIVRNKCITTVGQIRESYGRFTFKMSLNTCIWRCRYLYSRKKIRIFRSLVILVSLYSCQRWTLNTNLKRRIDVPGTRLFYRLMRYHLYDCFKWAVVLWNWFEAHYQHSIITISTAPILACGTLYGYLPKCKGSPRGVHITHGCGKSMGFSWDGDFHGIEREPAWGYEDVIARSVATRYVRRVVSVECPDVWSVLLIKHLFHHRWLPWIIHSCISLSTAYCFQNSTPHTHAGKVIWLVFFHTNKI